MVECMIDNVQIRKVVFMEDLNLDEETWCFLQDHNDDGIFYRGCILSFLDFAKDTTSPIVMGELKQLLELMEIKGVENFIMDMEAPRW